MATLADRADFCLLLILLVFTGAISTATERVHRRFDSTNGLAISTIFSLAQDAEGFIWIGTAGGVVRYDGNQMRPWAKDIIKRDVFTLATNAAGEIVVAEGSGTLYRVIAERVEPVAGPDGKPFTETRSAGFDNAGRLWVVTEAGALYLRDSTSRWKSFDVVRAFRGEIVRRVRSGGDDRVYVVTNKAIWRTRVGENPEKMLDVMRPVDIVEHPSGSVFVLAWQIEGEVIEIQRDGSIVSRFKVSGRAIDLVMRGGVVWAAFDRYLVSLRPNEPPNVISHEDGLPGGGPLLVDHEGSLWLGTFEGLIQYPEPETTIWNQKDGLPSAHTRVITQTAEGIWVTTWQGIGRLTREASAWTARDERIKSNSSPCAGSNGLLLFNTGEEVIERRDGRFVKHSPLPDGAGIYGCMRASDGTLLLMTARGIFRDNSEAKPPERVNSPPGENGEPADVVRAFEDSEHRLWAATADGRICHAHAAVVLSGQTASWSCQTIDQAPDIFDIVQFSSGNVWMSTNRAGIWRLRGDRWEPIPASRTLPSQVLFNLTLSPAGGVWLLGHGTTMRVVEREDIAEGWEVVEVLSVWEGLPGSNASDLIEEPDGSLWLATSLGVIRVPSEARNSDAAPPKVTLVDVVINGQSVSPNVDRPSLSGRQVELHFAALSYRDRSRLRYQYRLSPDSPWIESRDSAPVLRFVDLGAGDYEAEVRASLDGVNWTNAPARFAFQVLKPWYLRTWALIVFTLVISSILYAIYRARIAVMMRLERQRAQIARDLHDEMGSGLGSIGILAGVAGTNSLKTIEHEELARKISQTASELGTTLSEIVWALKPGTGSLEALAYRLAERGGRLFPSNDPAFTTQFPLMWPKVELSLAVRRNVLLIASEALHNTARHSQAKEVTLGLEPAHGKHWRLWVVDDGRGLSEGNSLSQSGMGLQNMRRRAEEIGAALSLSPNNGKGTSLSLIFDPSADDRRLA